jgi:hypothetical protein
MFKIENLRQVPLVGREIVINGLLWEICIIQYNQFVDVGVPGSPLHNFGHDFWEIVRG